MSAIDWLMSMTTAGARRALRTGTPPPSEAPTHQHPTGRNRYSSATHADGRTASRFRPSYPTICISPPPLTYIARTFRTTASRCCRLIRIGSRAVTTMGWAARARLVTSPSTPDRGGRPPDNRSGIKKETRHHLQTQRNRDALPNERPRMRAIPHRWPHC